MLTSAFPYGEGELVGADDDSDINLFRRGEEEEEEDENKNEARSFLHQAAPVTQIAQNPGMLAPHLSAPINIVAQVVSRGQR